MALASFLKRTPHYFAAGLISLITVLSPIHPTFDTVFIHAILSLSLRLLFYFIATSLAFTRLEQWS